MCPCERLCESTRMHVCGCMECKAVGDSVMSVQSCPYLCGCSQVKGHLWEHGWL